MSLTIFYNDTISVFDVPRDKANGIVSGGRSSLWILLADIWNAETGIAESDDEFEDLGIDLRHPGVNASEAPGAMEEFLKLGFGVAGKQLRSGAGAGSDDRFEDIEIDLGPPSVNASEASGVRNFCNWDLEEGDAA
ncbi:hypothetical protein ACFX13_012978 [Malus domestica]|uniref:Tify domain-containing protein n=1 Tax=Malus domestica TaxID=3750 RepID=A0A498IB42_MALDO|nr:hypothetical protein DVH24_001871 [Malus domestica]